MSESSENLLSPILGFSTQQPANWRMLVPTNLEQGNMTEVKNPVSPVPSSSRGFTTAGGKPVPVSEAAVAAARSLWGGEGGSAAVVRGTSDVFDFPGPVVPSNRGEGGGDIVTEEIDLLTRSVLNDSGWSLDEEEAEDETDAILLEAARAVEGGNCEVEADAAIGSEVMRALDDDWDGVDEPSAKLTTSETVASGDQSANVCVGFCTAAGKPVTVSKEALEAAKRKFEDVLEEEEEVLEHKRMKMTGHKEQNSKSDEEDDSSQVTSTVKRLEIGRNKSPLPDPPPHRRKFVVPRRK